MEPDVLCSVPAGEVVDWSADVFPALLAAGAPLFGYVTDGYWEDVGLRPQVALVGADVLPVTVRDIAVQRGAGGQQRRKHVGGPVHDLPGGDRAQDVRLHDVDAGVDRVGKDLAPGRLLQEPFDPAVRPGDNDAELQRIGDLS